MTDERRRDLTWKALLLIGQIFVGGATGFFSAYIGLQTGQARMEERMKAIESRQTTLTNILVDLEKKKIDRPEYEAMVQAHEVRITDLKSDLVDIKADIRQLLAYQRALR